MNYFSDCSAKNTSSDELIKAQTAKPTEDTIFGKIARKEIKIDLLHEDDQVFIYIYFSFFNLLNLVCRIS